MLSIIISTLGALGNLTFILLIVIYIFAILGMQVEHTFTMTEMIVVENIATMTVHQLFGKDYTEENFYPDPIPR